MPCTTEISAPSSRANFLTFGLAELLPLFETSGADIVGVAIFLNTSTFFDCCSTVLSSFFAFFVLSVETKDKIVSPLFTLSPTDTFILYILPE